MEMTVDRLDGGIVRVALRGRLDTPGVDSIETRLTASVVPTGASAVVDLSGVEFAGSMAIRMFVSIGKALARQGRRLALYSPQPAVAETFELVSLDAIVPVVADATGALEKVRL